MESFLVSQKRRMSGAPSKRELLALGALIGIAFFLIVYGTASLDVSYDSWILSGHVESDIACDYAGWVHYRNAPWSWPLGVNKNIGYPYGNAIAVSGPVAPMGLLFKVLSPLLPETFQFYGWWALLCYALQGMAAALLAGLFTDRRVSVAAICVLFVSSPVLAERAFRHCSLMIHFVVLLAYYLYIRRSRGFGRGQWWKYTLLTSCAVTVFPYFYPIVLGIMMASLLQTIRRPGGVRCLAGYWLANTTIPLACGWMVGLFYSKTPAARDGYGIFSMNLNQVINPQSYGDILWSRVFQVRPLVLAQYDGFNYLGLGVLLALPLLALAFLISVRKQLLPTLWGLARRHIWLGLVVIGFAAYAVSNQVYWGGLLVFSYPLPSAASVVTGLFRASSRIFYGTYYFLFLVAAALCCKVCGSRKRLASALLVLIAAVQLWDISPGLMWKHDYFAERIEYESRYDTELLQYVGEHYDRLIFLEIHDYNTQELSVLLGKYGLATNLNTSPLEDIYGSDEYVQEKLAELRAGEIDTSEAYVITQEALFQELSELLEGKMVAVSDENFNMLLPVLEGETPPESLPMVHDR